MTEGDSENKIVIEQCLWVNQADCSKWQQQHKQTNDRSSANTEAHLAHHNGCS